MENTTIHPFPGLRPFEEEEEHLFFGREKPVIELLSRLRTSRFVAVIGTSGSGKSSLIKAGLLPSLYRGFMAQAGSSWRVAVFRPGDNPIHNLAHALGNNLLLYQGSEDDPEQVEMWRKMMETTLRRSNRGLIETVKEARLPEHENLLIVVDQFEELFRFSKLERSHQEEKLDSAAFVNLLLESSSQTIFPIYVIITMRSDFLGDCTEFRGLPEAINRGQYLIPRMTRNEKREAIGGPIAVGGAEITPTLLSRVLNDVGNSPDQLPILQHALMRTWDYWAENHKGEEPLDLVHYEAIGTMERALAKHAEEAYRELKTEKNQTICEKMFKLLTDRGETGRGVRRPARVSEICAVTGASEREVIKVINVFRQPGRTFLMSPSEVKLNRDSVIDISHESLMRIWERLIQWVREEEQSSETYIRLAQAAALHEEGKTGLWRDPELMLALNWRDENKPNKVWADRYDSSFYRAARFLVASKKQKEFEIKEKERQQKVKIWTARIATAILGTLFIISSYFASWAFLKKNEAELAIFIAEEERIHAKNEQKKAEEQKKKADESAKRAAAAETEARKEAKESEQARDKAKREERKAKAKEIEAQLERLVVEMNREKEKFRQYLSKAKELAVQSAAEIKDTELKVLLALTAYRLGLKAFENLQQSTGKIFQKFDASLLDTCDRKEILTKAYERLNKVYNDLQVESKSRRQPLEIFEALRAAYIAREESQDIIFPDAESWALAAAANHIVFNDREGRLLMTPLRSGGRTSDLQVLDKPNTIDLSPDTQLQASCFAWSGARLFCGTQDGRIVYWENQGWNKTNQLVEHDAKILAMAFSMNRNSLLYSVKNNVYILSLGNRANVFPVFALEERNFIRALLLIEDPRNSILIIGDAKGNIFQSDLLHTVNKQKTLNTSLKSGGSAIHALAYNSSRKLLCLGNARGELYLFAGVDAKSLTSDTEVKSYIFDKKHKGIVRALAFSSDGRYLASGGLGGTIMLWDLKAKDTREISRMAPILSFGDNGKLLALVFDPGGEYMIFNDPRHLRVCPTNPDIFVEKLCQGGHKEFNKDQWNRYIGEFIKQEELVLCAGGK